MKDFRPCIALKNEFYVVSISNIIADPPDFSPPCRHQFRTGVSIVVVLTSLGPRNFWTVHEVNHEPLIALKVTDNSLTSSRVNDHRPDRNALISGPVISSGCRTILLILLIAYAILFLFC